uniref:GATA-type domain-containing protein n=1 Tax=Dromaius novaehollandiae TaxID=8790 RepID=A0A8C4J644_DRONO
ACASAPAAPTATGSSSPPATAGTGPPARGCARHPLDRSVRLSGHPWAPGCTVCLSGCTPSTPGLQRPSVHPDAPPAAPCTLPAPRPRPAAGDAGGRERGGRITPIGRRGPRPPTGTGTASWWDGHRPARWEKPSLRCRDPASWQSSLEPRVAAASRSARPRLGGRGGFAGFPQRRSHRRPSAGSRRCASCKTRRTPLWRIAEAGTRLCNACGIRYKKYRLRCWRCWNIPRRSGKPCSRCSNCGEALRPPGAQPRSGRR